MGQIAEDAQDGLTCSYCGVWMPDVSDAIEKKQEAILDNPPGFPRTCDDCREDHGKFEWE